MTLPNYEVGSYKIINEINKIEKKDKNFRYFKSLGINDYNNLLKFSEFVIGNSSSGIIEAPFHRIPTINIGSRQKGRYFHPSELTLI